MEMFRVSFLIVLAIWSTVHADNLNDAFETICVPGKTCYYVSKFKTSWETAQEMCQEKIHQQSANYNETDNVILNPLADNLLTKRYWVVENSDQISEENPNKLTILLDRKRRAVTRVITTKTVVTTVHEVKNWNWQRLVDNADGADHKDLRNNIHEVFEMVRKKGENNLNPNELKRWEITYKTLKKARTHRRFQRTHEKWLELIDRYGKAKILRLIKLLKPDLKNEWETKLHEIKSIIKNKQYDKLNPELLARWKRIIYIIERSIQGKDRYIHRLMIRWNRHVKLLNKWKWQELTKYVSGNYKDRVIKTINQLILVVQSKQIEKINLQLVNNVNFVMRLLNRLWTVHVKYGGFKQAELIRNVKLIVTTDWKKLINEIDGVDKNKWIERFHKMIHLIKLKQYNKIDQNWLIEFNEIINKIRTKVTLRPLIGKRKIRRITNYLRLLKIWNWQELVKTINPKDRQRFINEIEILINIFQRKQYQKIDFKMINNLRKTFRILRKIRHEKRPKVDPKIEIKRLINKYKFIVDIDWMKIINETKNIDKVKWTKRIQKLIELIKQKKFDEIDLKWLIKFKKVIKVIRKVTNKIPLTKERMIINLTKYVHNFNNLNWKELIKNVEEKDRVRITQEIELVTKIIKEKRFNEIDLKFFERIKPIIRLLTKIDNAKRPNIRHKIKIKNMIKNYKFIVDVNWMKIIDEAKGIDKIKWTKRINELVQLIKLNQWEKIDFKWLKEFQKIIRIIRKETDKVPLTKEKSIEKITDYVIRFNKINWRELIKIVDEKEREKFTKEIELVTNLIKEKRFNEIDFNLVTRIRPIIRMFEKTENRKKPKVDPKIEITKLIKKYKFIVDIDWMKIINENKEIDKVKWTARINKLIDLIKRKEFDKIDINWLNKFKKVIKIIRKQTQKKPLTKEKTIEKITKIATRIKNLNWRELIKTIDVKDRETFSREIEIITNLIKENRLSEIDINMVNRVRPIIRLLEKTKNRKKPTIEEEIKIKDLINKYKHIVNVNWKKIIDETKGIDKVRWTRQLEKLVELIKLNQISNIDLKWLEKFETINKILSRKIIIKPTNNQIQIVKTSIKYINNLNEINWEELVKYIDEKKRPDVINKIRTFLSLVHNKKFEKIDLILLNWVTTIVKTLQEIKKVDIRNKNIIKENQKKIIEASSKHIDTLNELKWEELIKYIDERNRPEVHKKINTFITFVLNKQFEKIDVSLLNWITQTTITLKEIKQIDIRNQKIIKENQRQIIEASTKHINSLKELKWEELIKYIEERSRPDVRKTINTFITFVQDKHFEKIDVSLLNRITQIVVTLREIQEIDNRNKIIIKENQKKIIETSTKNIEFLHELKWEELVKYIEESKRPEVINKIQTFVTLVLNKHFEKIDVTLLNWITQIITTLKDIKQIDIRNQNIIKENQRKIIETSTRHINILNELKWEELVKYVEENSRPDVVRKIQTFITFVHNKEFEKIDVELLNWVTQTITTLKEIQVIDTKNKIEMKENQRKIIEISKKNIDSLNEVNWQELVKYIDERSRPDVIRRIKQFNQLSIDRQFEKIDIELLNHITHIIATLKEVKEIDIKNQIIRQENQKKIIEASTTYMNLLTELKWKELVKYIEDKKRPEVIDKIEVFIRFVEDKKFEKIDVNLLNWITQIISTLREVKEIDTKNQIVLRENQKKIIEISTRNINLLKELKWEELVKYIEENNRQEVIRKIQTFSVLTRNKQFEKIDVELLNWITQTINKLKEIKEIDSQNQIIMIERQKHIIELSNQYLVLLNDLKWEELVQYIDESSRLDTVRRIKTFINLVQTKQFEKIDVDILNWLTRIINSMKNAREISKNQLVANDRKAHIIKLSNQYVTLLIELKWEELLKYIDESSRPEVTSKIRTFITQVQNKQFETIEAEILNWLTQTITMLRNLREIDTKNEQIMKENKKQITETSTKYIGILTELKWEELIKFIHENQRPQVTQNLKTFIRLVQNNEIEKIDVELLNRITHIIDTLQEIKVIDTKNQNIIKENLKIIIDKSTKDINVLNELKWEELVKYIDENNRPDVVNKIKTFIVFVENKQFEKIDLELMNYITQITVTLKEIKTVDEKNQLIVKENKKKIEEQSNKYITILNELKWEELIKFIEESNRIEVVKRIRTFISLIENKQIDKIDVDHLNWITQIIRTLTKVKEIDTENQKIIKENQRIIIETSTKHTDLLNELKWEELVKYIDESSRPEVVRKIKTFVNLVQNKQAEQIDIELLNHITHIIGTLKEIQVIDIKNKNIMKENQKAIIEVSNKYIKIINELKWEELIKYIDENSRPDVVNNLKIFITHMESKQYEKIDNELLNWVTQIIETLEKVKKIDLENQKIIEENRRVIIESSTKNIEILNELKWEELVKYIDEGSRPEVINKIKTFITLVLNKQAEKIDRELLNWITQIIVHLRKAKETDTQNQLILKENQKIIEETTTKYINILNELKWEELIKYIHENSRPEVINRIRTFITLAKNNQTDKIDAETLNWITQIISTLREMKQVDIKNQNIIKENQRIILEASNKHIEVLNELKWEELIKYVDESSRPDVINRIKTFITFVKTKQTDKIDIPLLNSLTQIIESMRKAREIDIENQRIMKENQKRIVEISNKNIEILTELKWEELVKYIDEHSRPDVINRIKTFFALVKDNQVDKLNIESLNWITQIIEKLVRVKEIDIKNQNIIKENQRIIIETSSKKIDILNELKWEELIKYIDESSRPEFVNKIKTFITLVHNKQTDKIDLELINRITNIVSTLKNVKEIDIKNQKILKEKVIAETATKHIEVLNELKWEELIKYIDESDRPNVVNRIKTYITLVKNNQIDKIDIQELNSITKIISTLRKVKEIDIKNQNIIKENQRVILEISNKNIDVLNELKWEELLKYIDERSRPDVTSKIKTFITLVKNKETDKIDVSTMNSITQIIKVLREVQEIDIKNKIIIKENEKVKIDKSKEFVEILTELKWEELLNYIDESSRPLVVTNIKSLINLVSKQEFGKIDLELLNSITQIINILRKVKEIDIKNQNIIKENKRIIIETSTKQIDILKELKWEELLKYIHESDRPEVTNTIKSFITLVLNQQTDKIDIRQVNSITQIIETLQKVKEIDIRNENIMKENQKVIIDASTKYIQILNELKWEELVKYIDERSQPEVVNQIKNFIKLMENKEFDKINRDLLNWITQIIKTLQQVQEIDLKNQKIVRENQRIIVETSTKYIDTLNELQWEELLKYIHENDRPVVTNRIKSFVTLVQTKQTDKIDIQLLNSITQIIDSLRRVKEIDLRNKNIMKENQKTIIETSAKYIDVLNELKWEELIKYVEEGSRPEVINKIKTFTKLMQNKEFDKIDVELLNWITQIISMLRQVREIDDKNQNIIKENQKIIKEASIKYIGYLNELKWQELVQYIVESSRAEVINKINIFSTFVQNKEFEKIDSDLLNWITTIINTLRKMKVTNTSTTIVNKMQINLPSNWIELLKRIQGIDHNLWISRIQGFLSKGNEYQKIEQSWIEEFQRIISLINQESVNIRKTVLNEESISTLKSQVKSLKEWKWETYIMYIEESKQQEIQQNIANVISIVDSGKYDSLDVQFISWFNQIFEVFTKINHYKASGYVYESATRTWVKNMGVVKSGSRRKRSVDLNDMENLSATVNVHLLNRAIKSLQKALLYNMMIERNNKKQINRSMSRHGNQCPFINKVNEKLTTKLTNCAIKQRFICKRQLN